MKIKNTILSLICITFICVGCAGAEPSPTATAAPPTTTPKPPTATPVPPTDTPEPPTLTPTEELAEFPIGKFYNSSFLYTLILNEDGTWSVGAYDKMFGHYHVEGDQVTFSDESGWCISAGEGGEDGIFTWTYIDGVLQLKSVKDICHSRKGWLTVPYKLQ
jgi:hypothetical protein